MKLPSLVPLVTPLLDWYPKNARALPWRENKDPYRVLVSEIMLQQTRVEAVIPYFHRFLKALPDVAALADAPEMTLLKLWEGLGYYNRVRNLQRAARQILSDHGGVFPTTATGLRTLSGVGPYTAGAIASICFEEPAPAVDGNVLRVVMRFTGCDADITKTETKKAVTEGLAAVYPAGRCGDFTQALMELGALVCLPNGAPRCEVCPLAELCAANQLGKTQVLPVKAQKSPRRKEEWTVFLLRCGEKVAIRRRPAKGLLASLWELPGISGGLTDQEALRYCDGLGLEPLSLRRSLKNRHIFTHVEWDMVCYEIECARPVPDFVWVSPGALQEEYPLPSAFRPFLSLL